MWGRSSELCEHTARGTYERWLKERTVTRLVCKLKIYQGHIRGGREDRVRAVTRVQVRAQKRILVLEDSSRHP